MYTWMHKWTPSVHITLEYDHYSDRRDYLAYELSSNGHVIFEGNDFSPSPLIKDRLSEESVMSLLGFLTLQKGDTDPEYFDSYTLRQLEWIEGEESEKLRSIAFDYENEGE